MAAVIEFQAHGSVARREQRKVGRNVRLRPGVCLNVRVVCPKQRLGSIDRDLLDHVNELAAAVVALAGVAFRVLVGQHRAHRREDRLGRIVLRGNQFEAVALSTRFRLDR